MQLRDYQKDAIRALWDTFRANPTARPLIVCPVGSGKSVICAEIIKQIKLARKDWRILVLTHRKEIVRQNAEKYQQLTKEPVGVVSAGLGSKVIRQVTFANIQSIYRDVTHWDVVIIDECHLISGKPESMYGKFLDKQSAKVIGLTATPYRMDHGFLIGPGSLFSHVAYEISIEHLIGQGHLSPLVSVPSKEQIDLSEVTVRGFDYAQEQLETAANRHIETHARDILARTADKRHVLVFCSGVSHAQQLAALLGGECVHGGLAAFERDRMIERFKSGHNKYLTNCDILTTGFDFPAIDCIALVRATRSVGLYVQMVGRGSRTAPEKANCLVLDYGCNIKRHGPIDQIHVEYKEKGARFSVPPLKSCDSCGCVVNIRIMKCPACGAAFPEGSNKYTAAPDSAPILSKNSFDVSGTNCKVHYKVGGIPSLRVDYHLLIDEVISDFWCFGHTGYAREKACQTWAKFGGKLPAPNDAEEAFTRFGELRTPSKIQAKKDGKYWRVTSVLAWHATVPDEPQNEVESLNVF